MNKPKEGIDEEVERPEDVRAYLDWFAKRGVEIDDRQRAHFETVVVVAAEQFTNSSFWLELLHSLPEWDDQYKLDKGVPLLIHHGPEVLRKSYGSFILKTFRKNVLENRGWPKEPREGWLEPPNWLFAVNDVVRTLLLVKYLDGVRVLTDHVVELAEKHGIGCVSSYEATSEGYYAAHLTLRARFRVPSLEFSLEDREISVEIQISTQLQEAIRDLLHRHYEIRRALPPSAPTWQWDYESAEFSTNYLGHVLHYIEGKIVEIRERREVET